MILQRDRQEWYSCVTYSTSIIINTDCQKHGAIGSKSEVGKIEALKAAIIARENAAVQIKEDAEISQSKEVGSKGTDGAEHARGTTNLLVSDAKLISPRGLIAGH